MADTGEDREIKQRVNAHQAEVVRESKQLQQRNKRGRIAENVRRNASQPSPSGKKTPRSVTDPAAPPEG